MTPAISLSPKSLFQKQEDANKAFTVISHNHHFHVALSAALAEYAQNNSPSEESLKGARNFINVLLNLSKPIEGRKPIPMKTLDHYTESQTKDTTPQEKV